MNYFDLALSEPSQSKFLEDHVSDAGHAIRLVDTLGYGQPSHDQAWYALEQVGRKDALSAIISDVLVDSDKLAKTLEMSYPHALGFDKIVLRELSNGVQIRLHIWHPDKTRILEDIHDHRYSFVSKVISGVVINRLFSSTPSADGTHVEYREGSLPFDNQWSFQRFRQVDMRVESRRAYVAGSTYLVTRDDLHTVEVPEGVSASTLYVQMPSERSWTSVIRSATAPSPVTRPQIRFSRNELLKTLITYQRSL